MKISVLVLFTGFTLLSTTTKVIDDSNIKPTMKIEFDSSLKAKVKLAEVVIQPSYCGIFKWVKSYKFEFLDSANISMSPGHFINIEFTCPREMGSTFFQKGKAYNFIIQKEMNISNADLKNNQPKDSIPKYIFISKL